MFIIKKISPRKLLRESRTFHNALLVAFLCMCAVVCIYLASQLSPHANHTYGQVHVQSQLLDNALQLQATKVLRDTLDSTNAKQGCVLVMDTRTGTIKALVNVYSDETMPESNLALTSAWEPGSVMKTLLVAAALDTEKVSPETTRFFDTGIEDAGGYRVTNALTYPPRTITLQTILTDSLNTGALKVLKTLGDSDDVNVQARSVYYRYLTDHYLFGDAAPFQADGQKTGFVPQPQIGDHLSETYAHMAIGESMTVTPLQLLAAYGSVINGGTLFLPAAERGAPPFSKHSVISVESSKEIKKLLETAFASNNKLTMRKGFQMGGKTGTAHQADTAGEYRVGARDNGTYIGFVENDSSADIMLVRIDSPKTNGFASGIAKQAWNTIVTGLIDKNGRFVND